MIDNIKTQFDEEIAKMHKNGTYKNIGVIDGKQGTMVVVDGKKVLNFCANNYLGLAATDELAEAAQEGAEKYGFGMASVRFICGTSTIHIDLEKEVSKFFGTEDTLLYTSCFDANTGLFETILQAGDAIFSDALNHASIIDGIRLCKADRFRYLHSDMDDLEAKLKEAGERRRKLIVSDGVFSMDGDTANISGICDLAEKYGALVVIDDSHGSGVLGENGRGSIEGHMDRVDLLTSTFGKALGGAGGGFTTGRKEIIEYLHQCSRTTLFSNSLPPMIANAALYVLQNFDGSLKKYRNKLAGNTKYFRQEISKLGLTLGGDGKHPINPVMVFEESIAADMAEKLYAEGIYARGFTYPVVPQGKARVRVQISAAHTRDQIDKAVAAFAKVKDNYDIPSSEN